MIADTEEELIKRLNDWKDNVESKGMRVSMNKTKVMISGERQKVRQKAVRWPCGVCSKGVGSNSSGTGQPGSPRPKAVKRLCVCVIWHDGCDAAHRTGGYTAVETCSRSIQSVYTPGDSDVILFHIYAS